MPIKKKLTCNATCCRQHRYCSDSSRPDRTTPTDRYRIIQVDPFLGRHRPITVYCWILKNKISFCQSLITQIYCWLRIEKRVYLKPWVYSWHQRRHYGNTSDFPILFSSDKRQGRVQILCSRVQCSERYHWIVRTRRQRKQLEKNSCKFLFVYSYI